MWNCRGIFFPSPLHTARTINMHVILKNEGCSLAVKCQPFPFRCMALHFLHGTKHTHNSGTTFNKNSSKMLISEIVWTFFSSFRSSPRNTQKICWKLNTAYSRRVVYVQQWNSRTRDICWVSLSRSPRLSHVRFRSWATSSTFRNVDRCYIYLKICSNNTTPHFTWIFPLFIIIIIIVIFFFIETQY